jgi:hypothetical protein
VYASILRILLDAKRGGVVTRLVCTDCQYAIVLLRLAPVETLNSMRRSVKHSIPSDGRIDRLSRSCTLVRGGGIDAWIEAVVRALNSIRPVLDEPDTMQSPELSGTLRSAGHVMRACAGHCRRARRLVRRQTAEQAVHLVLHARREVYRVGIARRSVISRN